MKFMLQCATRDPPTVACLFMPCSCYTTIGVVDSPWCSHCKQRFVSKSHARSGIRNRKCANAMPEPFIVNMDAGQNAALQFVCALICSEKRKTKKKRVWKKDWMGTRGQHGLSVLQRQLEIRDGSGFRELLRMTSEEFDFLLGLVEDRVRKQHTKMRRAISPRERLSLTLRYLASGETFRSLGLQYRIGASTISQIVMETCDALYQTMKEDFLKASMTEGEWRTVAQEFEQKWQFPHCLGALDGKLIHIQPPGKRGSVYHSSSVVIMAVVDANYKFIYASVGTQGCVSDAWQFANSDLHRAMDEAVLNFPPPEPLPNSSVVMPFMFVGDEACPLRPDLMKPYSFRQMDHGQRVLNYRLSRARRVVENAFGILANRLRVFRSTVCLEPHNVVKITMASLCIHNFLCERRSEAYTPPALADWENADHHMVDGAWRQNGMGAFQPLDHQRECNLTLTAKAQRDLLQEYFVSPVGSVDWQDVHI